MSFVVWGDTERRDGLDRGEIIGERPLGAIGNKRW